MNERMKLDPNLETIENSAVYDQLTLESVDFFVRMMSIMGLPRSVGEIYGLLYFSPSPLSMDQIRTKLEISVGSASQLRAIQNHTTTVIVTPTLQVSHASNTCILCVKIII